MAVRVLPRRAPRVNYRECTDSDDDILFSAYSTLPVAPSNKNNTTPVVVIDLTDLSDSDSDTEESAASSSLSSLSSSDDEEPTQFVSPSASSRLEWSPAFDERNPSVQPHVPVPSSSSPLDQLLGVSNADLLFDDTLVPSSPPPLPPAPRTLTTPLGNQIVLGTVVSASLHDSHSPRRRRSRSPSPPIVIADEIEDVLAPPSPKRLRLSPPPSPAFPSPPSSPPLLPLSPLFDTEPAPQPEYGRAHAIFSDFFRLPYRL